MFKVGDYVIGNEKAGLFYSITKKGWVGRVGSIQSSHIEVTSLEGNTVYRVIAKCFNLLDNKDLIKIKNNKK